MPSSASPSFTMNSPNGRGNGDATGAVSGGRPAHSMPPGLQTVPAGAYPSSSSSGGAGTLTWPRSGPPQAVASVPSGPHADPSSLGRGTPPPKRVGGQPARDGSCRDRGDSTSARGGSPGRPHSAAAPRPASAQSHAQPQGPFPTQNGSRDGGPPSAAATSGAYPPPSHQEQPLPETALRGPGRGSGPALVQPATAASSGERGSNAMHGGTANDSLNGASVDNGGSAPYAPSTRSRGAAREGGMPARGWGDPAFARRSSAGTASSASREPGSEHHGHPPHTAPPSRHVDPTAGSGSGPSTGSPPRGPSRSAQGPTPPSSQQQQQYAPALMSAAPPAAPAASLASGNAGTRPSPRQGRAEAAPPSEQLLSALPASAPAQLVAGANESFAPTTRPPPPPQPQSQSQPPRSHPLAATPSSSSTAAHQPPPPPSEASEPNLARPAKALSCHLMALYKIINGRYCAEQRLASPGPKYNRGYDDKDGHYVVLAGEEILNRYTVQEVLGKGSFGTVLRCYDEKRREAVALKITRHGSNFRSQAKLELDILLKLNENPNLNHLVVKLLKVFDWQGHLILVFELLSFNLYQLIKCTRYNGVSLELVRKFAYQLVCTLLQLEQQKPQAIIHCDIKPENILLRNQNRSGIRLIDFGSACYAEKCVHKYIQSRFYRSPEVILHLGYTTAIDRWSLGCVLVELHTGMPLFDGRSEAAQLARFEAALGPVPAHMVAASGRAMKFYDVLPDGKFQLREPPLPRHSLESVIGVTTGGPRGSRRGTQGHDEGAYWEFLDFIMQLLRYEPAERISCQDALRHPFLAPLFLSDQQQRHARRQQQQQRQQPQQCGGVGSGPAGGPSAPAPADSTGDVWRR